MSKDRRVYLDLLCRVGRMSYLQDIPQNEIAEQLNLSRAKVCRMLKEARKLGIVQITVRQPPGLHAELEEQLESRFGLKDAVVVECDQPRDAEVVARVLGVAAADYLQQRVERGDVIGLTWGYTLDAMVAAMGSIRTDEVRVVQLLGGLDQSDAQGHATTLCARLAARLSARVCLLPLPGIVDSEAIRRVMLSDSHVKETFALFPKLTTAYVGIGAPLPSSMLVRDKSIGRGADLKRLAKHGAVGDIALRYFDIEGKPMTTDFDDRIIGVDLPTLQKIPYVVGVAGGLDKKPAILGALRGRYLHALIVDEPTARTLL